MIDLTTPNRRILLIDDNPAIHEDFRKILINVGPAYSVFDQEASDLFGSDTPTSAAPTFILDSAFQGEEALGKIQQALDAHRPYAMAFVDMRMPPGWDGRETIKRAWEIAPDLQAVICTAYSDHRWEAIHEALGSSDRLLILKKPFDQIEVMQLALALTEKWNLSRLAKLKTEGLEELVRIRTLELVQAQQSKSNFLRNISLELLTPMNGILGLADLIAETATNSEQSELIVGLQKSGQRLMQLLGDVLTYNTIEAGQLEVQRVEFDVRQLGQAAVDAFAEKAQAKGVELQLTLAPELPTIVQGDPKQLRSVLAILLENAIKFSDQGTLLVRAERATDNVPALVIAVCDQGEGITADQLVLLRQPFSQIDGSTTRKGMGIGMGLTLAKQLLQLMGLQLKMESQLGQGSTFSFELPLAPESSTMKIHTTATSPTRQILAAP